MKKITILIVSVLALNTTAVFAADGGDMVIARHEARTEQIKQEKMAEQLAANQTTTVQPQGSTGK